MAGKKLLVPSFKTERQEAAWWEEHRAEIESNLRAAMRGKKAVSLTEVFARAERRKPLLPVTLRLPVEDISTARQLAGDHGIGYQTYIKIILHEALRKAAGHRSRGLTK